MQVKLSVKYFDHEDLAALNDWLVARGRKREDVSDIPAVGFIVSHDDMKVAACFLRRCEGNVGIVDGLTSNPDAPPEIRHAALDVAINCVCEEAKQREITRLMAWTVDNSALIRGCERHGFAKLSHILMSKDLSEPLKIQ